MSIDAKIILDSISETGARLTTMELTMPRIILAEFNTHRAFSRNSASSRAVSVRKKIEEARNNPFIPQKWTQNERGMQGQQITDQDIINDGEEAWLQACESACIMATALDNYGFHKQICNRLLEPFLWHKIIVTSTEWDNFLAQRCSPLAEPHMEILANNMRDALHISTPQQRNIGEWHLPYMWGTYNSWLVANNYTEPILVSAARCARVSYQHHGQETKWEEDLKIGKKLLEANPPHFSPYEHQAQAMVLPVSNANFVGWHQARHHSILKNV